VNHIDGHLARNFTRGSTTHAVAHRKQHASTSKTPNLGSIVCDAHGFCQVGNQVVVFIVLTHPTYVGDTRTAKNNFAVFRWF
jgi:hypothetical protein